MASIVSLLDDFLIFRTKHALGFVNPLLYLISHEQEASREAGEYKEEGINDVKIRRNLGCNTGGFPAATGWDPVRSLALVSFPNHFRCLADFLIYTRSLV